MATKKQAVKKQAAGKAEKMSTKAAPVETGTLQELPLEKVLPTKDNKRQIDPKSPDIASLAESLKVSGQILPVLVRPHPTKKGFYDLRAGERRLVACQAAGLKTIVALVKDLDDAEAKRVTVLENLQREDLKPLEESAAVGELVATGQSLREIAAQVGMSHQWVARRARLTELIPEWKKRFEAAGTPATAMELIAAFEPAEQKAWLDKVSDYQLDNPAEATARIAERIQSETRQLDKAVFNHTAECGACDRRTGKREPGLFDAKERCLNQACFEAKTQRRLGELFEQLQTIHPRLVKVAKDEWCDKPDVIQRYDWEPSKPNGKNALPALIVAGPGMGSLIWINKLRGGAEGSTKQEGPKSLKQKKDELESKRWAETVNRFARDLDKMPIDRLVNPAHVVLLAATFGVRMYIGDGSMMDFEALEGLGPKMAKEKAEVTLWEAVRQVIADRLEWLGPVTQYDWKDRPVEAQRVANLVNVTLRDVYDQVCQEKGFTVPKSWAEEGKE